MSISDRQRLQMLQSPVGRPRIVIDTDTFNEIDDQFALTHIMLSRDQVDVEAIYAAPFLNQRSGDPHKGMELSYSEILRLLDRLQIEPGSLVHKGVGEFVGPEKQAKKADAVDDLISRARAGSSDNPLYVIAIAAASNIASAILAAPDIIDKMVVIWLGAHALNWPNIREFNLRQDVGAAQILFDSGVPLVLIPCQGVTSHLFSTVPEIERYVEPKGEIGRFLAQRFKEYSDDHLGWSKPIWDMAATAWILDETWVPSNLTSTPIITDNMTWSRDDGRPLMRYVHSVNRDGILKDFFNKLDAFAAQ